MSRDDQSLSTIEGLKGNEGVAEVSPEEGGVVNAEKLLTGATEKINVIIGDINQLSTEVSGDAENNPELTQEIVELRKLETEVTEVKKTLIVKLREILDMPRLKMDVVKIKKGEFDFDELRNFSPEYNKKLILKLIELGEFEVVAHNLEKFSGLDKEIALKLIEAGQAINVAYNLEKFSGLDKEIALKLIEAGQSWVVIQNPDKFSGLVLDKALAFKLIDLGQVGLVDQSLEKFSGLVLDKALALELLDKKLGGTVARNLYNFSGLDKEVSFGLIELDRADDVAHNLEKFSGLDKEIALKLIESSQAINVAYNLEKFSGLDKEIALKLIEAGQAWVVIQNPDKLSDLVLDKEIALKMVEADESQILIKNVGKFSDLVLDKEIALKVIESGQVETVTHNLEKFSGLGKEIALKMIEFGQAGVVAWNLEKFSGLDKEIVFKLIEVGQVWGIKYNLEKFSDLVLDKALALELIDRKQNEIVGDNLRKFSGLDKEIAFKLIEASYARIVIMNLEKFSDLVLDKEVVLRIIEAGQAEAVVYGLEKFSDLVLDKEVAIKMIEAGRGGEVVKYSERFSGLVLDETLAFKLIESGQAGAVAHNLERFSGLVLDEILAFKLIELKQAGEVVKYSERFSGLVLDETLAFKLIESGQAKTIIENLEKFSGLGKDIAFKLIRLFGQYEIIVKNLEKFSGLDKDFFTSVFQDSLERKKLLEYFSIWSSKFSKDELLSYVLHDGAVRKKFITEFARSYPLAFTGLTGTEGKGTDNITPLLQYFYEKHDFELDDSNAEVFSGYVKEFGVSTSDVLFVYYKNILDKKNGSIAELPEEQLISGLDTVEKLHERLLRIRKALIDGEILPPEEMTALDYDILKIETRFETSRWARPGKNIQNMHREFYDLQTGGKIEELHDGYEEEKLQVERVEVKKIDYSDCQIEYSRLRTDLLSAHELLGSGGIDKFRQKLKESLTSEIESVVIVPDENPKKVEHLEKRRNFLTKCMVEVSETNDVNKIMKSLMKLEIDLGIKSENPTTSPFLRTILFSRVIEGHSGFGELPDEVRVSDQANLEGLQYVRDIIQNVIKQHILLTGDFRQGEEGKKRVKSAVKKYFGGVEENFPTVAEASRLAKNLVNNKISELLKNIEGDISGNKQKIRMIPDRGFVGELSGYYADACWTSQDMFLRDWPNITPYKFVTGEEKNQEIIGSVLFVESKDQSGDKVIIVRGLNPRDKYLNTLQGESFCEEVFESALRTAERVGAKKVLVAGASGSTSNREKVNSYVGSSYGNDDNRVILSSSLAFNGYEIQNECYLVREVKEDDKKK